MLEQIKLGLALAGLIGVLSLFVWFADHERELEKQKIESQFAAQVAAAQKTAAEEAAHHAQIDSETIGSLQTHLAASLLAAASPVPVDRLCYPATGAGTLRQTGPVAGSVPAVQSAAAGDVPPVSDGIRVGPDIGPGLHDIATAAEVVSDYYRALRARDLALDPASAVPGHASGANAAPPPPGPT